MAASPVPLFEAFGGSRGCSVEAAQAVAATAAGNITVEELQELRALRRPPPVVRRTLEATCLILCAGDRGARPVLATPSWDSVQRIMASANFTHRMLDFDVASLRSHKALTAFVATEYFECRGSRRSTSRASSLGKRSSPLPAKRGSLKPATLKQEPLTFAKVHRANHAASALFRWCGAILVSVGEPLDLSDEALGGEADIDASESPVANAADVLVEESDSLRSIETFGEKQENDMEDDVAVDLEAASLFIAPPSPPIEREDSAEMLLASLPRETIAAWAEPTMEDEMREADRHFEEVVCFPFGEHFLGEEQETALRGVAAIVSKRPSLRLKLVGCTNDVEEDHMVTQRLRSVEQFFADAGLPCRAVRDNGLMEVSARWPLGIVCQILLDDDRALRELFLERWTADASPRTQDIADLLESKFHCCLH
eukprot:TRINITY_DN44791_c0_g1_i1.p1 TRINITY_DN44791_c0_g1~~TRINITY_DN44791_c0_g1_i1.p1  ORF type:complete len:437 (-),score=71.05 TRINITY_DN44791_c0_g1_i1:71-1351(-)